MIVLNLATIEVEDESVPLLVGVDARPSPMDDGIKQLYRPAIAAPDGSLLVLSFERARALAALLTSAITSAEELHRGQDRYGWGPPWRGVDATQPPAEG